MSQHLSSHHRSTLEQIFNHEAAGNVEWRKVHSLLEAIGEVDQRHDGKLAVKVGPESEVFHVPSTKDVDRQVLVDLRRMLTEAGFAPGDEGVEGQRDRDYGDSRWGKPT